MPNPSKQKGDRFERATVNALKAAGFDARKIPLSGACVGYPGDLEIHHDRGHLLVQNKHFKSSWKFLYKCLGNSSSVLLAPRSTGTIYVLCEFPRFIRWLHNPDEVWSMNWRITETNAKGVIDAINGHEVLLFKNDNKPILAVLDTSAFYALNAPRPTMDAGRSGEGRGHRTPT